MDVVHLAVILLDSHVVGIRVLLKFVVTHMWDDILFLNSRCAEPIRMFLKKRFSFRNAGDMIPMSTVPNTFGV